MFPLQASHIERRHSLMWLLLQSWSLNVAVVRAEVLLACTVSVS